MVRAILLLCSLLTGAALGALVWGNLTTGADDAETHLRAGTRLLDEGRFEEGGDRLRLALASSRVEILKVARHNLGVAFLEMARREDGIRAGEWAAEAVSHAEAALRLDPGLQAAAWNLELALRRLEELKRRDSAVRAERARRLLASFSLEEEERIPEFLEEALAKAGGRLPAGQEGGPWW